MRDFYTIDFETYYDTKFSLGKLTTQEYVMSDEFEIIGVSIKKNNEVPCFYSYDWFTEKDEYARVLNELERGMVLAHNAMFDCSILSHHFDIHPELILDTLSMAKPHHGLTVGGSLKALAKEYDIGEKGTEVIDAKGKRRADMLADDTLDAYGDYCNNDVALTFDLFKILKPKTHNDELKVIDGTIRMMTTPKLVLDAELLEEALVAEQDNKGEALEMAGVPKELVMSNHKLAKLLEALEVEVPMKISPTTHKEVPAFAKSDAGFQELLNHPTPLVKYLVQARLANKSTINESRMERLLNLSALGPLWVPLGYCNAVTTWRWGGQDGLNMQNLPNRQDNTIRRAIMAPDGFKLVVADSSNIELRTNHTLAGQTDVIQALREGRDLYSEFAAEDLYQVPLDEVTKDQRFVGKVAHLLLGYQGGWKKFQEMVREMGMEIDDDEAQRIVYAWRSRYDAIPRFWKNAEKLIQSMLDGIPFELPTAEFISAKQDMLITPPHHFIKYPHLQRTMDGVTYTSRRGRGTETVYLYGGKLVENLCQHISRNILAEQLVKINERYDVALMVHDEFVCVVPEDEADEALTWILDVMSTPPDWWPEIPLAAEGEIADRYGDAK